MTNEEAIKELELIARVTMWNDRREAVEMAIEALECQKEPKTAENGYNLTETAENNADRTTGDCISRQAATSIPILPKEHRKIFKSIDDAFETGWNEALSCVNMLPSAQPERKTGKWIEGQDMPDYPRVNYKYGEMYCSNCKNKAHWDRYMDIPFFDFCPYCNADMRGEEDDKTGRD